MDDPSVAEDEKMQMSLPLPLPTEQMDGSKRPKDYHSAPLLSIRVQKDLREVIDAEAAARGLSRNALIVAAIRSYLGLADEAKQ